MKNEREKAKKKKERSKSNNVGLRYIRYYTFMHRERERESLKKIW